MEALGLNIVSITIYIILFVVVYLVLNKFLVKKLLQIIEQRQQTAKNSIDLQTNLQKQMAEMEQKKKESFAATKAESMKTVAEVLHEAKAEKAKILEEAKKEAQAIVEKAEKFLDQERVKLEAEMAAKVEAAARKVVKEVYQANKTEIDQKLIEQALKGLK